MIGIDTFSWRKIINLIEADWKEPIIELIDGSNIFITSEGLKEFNHYFSESSYLLDKIAILPLLKSPKYRDYLIKYDANDASLLDYIEVNNFRIISEDGPLLIEGITTKRNIVQLFDFLFEKYKVDEFFSKREIYKLLKLFEKWKNITKKKIKYYKHLI